MPGGDGCNLQRFRYDEVLRRTDEKIEEGLPGSVGLRLIQSLERHVKQQYAIGAERDRLSPMGIKERLVIEAHECANQFAERGVGVRLYQTLHSAEECRELVGRKCQPRNNAKAAAAAALQRPEKIRIGAGVSDEYLAACGNNLGLQQARRG